MGIRIIWWQKLNKGSSSDLSDYFAKILQSPRNSAIFVLLNVMMKRCIIGFYFSAIATANGEVQTLSTCFVILIH